MAIIYRLQKSKRNNTVLTGEGAKLYGGRWNAVGVPLIYGSASSSLAVLESLVHIDKNLLIQTSNWNIVVMQVPDECIQHYSRSVLPQNWDALPFNDCAQQFLTPWLTSGNTLACSVPSVVNPNELNFLINPKHPDISKVMILSYIPYSFDNRLMAISPSSLVFPSSIAA